MHPDNFHAHDGWTLVQRGRRQWASRDPRYPPPLMGPSMWAAPATDGRFRPVADPHERFWAPRDLSPRYWDGHTRLVRDWSPCGPAQYHHKARFETYRPAYSPPRREAQRPLRHCAHDVRRAPRPPVRDPGPPGGPPRTRRQVQPPPTRPGPRPRDRPRPPRRPGPQVATAARTGSARPPPPRAAPWASAAPRSEDPDSRTV